MSFLKFYGTRPRLYGWPNANDEEEKAGLRIKAILTKGELNEFEQQKIEEALQWVYGRKLKAEDVFSEKFICNLHKRMFGKVWAGTYRKTEKNLGIPFIESLLRRKNCVMMPYFGSMMKATFLMNWLYDLSIES